jgi:hypothetical protein
VTTGWNWVARAPPAGLNSAEGLAVGVKVMSVGQPIQAVLRSMFVSADFAASISRPRHWRA